MPLNLMKITFLKKQKIILITNSAWNVYNFRMKLIEYLAEAGYDVLVLAPETSIRLLSKKVNFADCIIYSTSPHRAPILTRIYVFSTSCTPSSDRESPAPSLALPSSPTSWAVLRPIFCRYRLFQPSRGWAILFAQKLAQLDCSAARTNLLFRP